MIIQNMQANVLAAQIRERQRLEKFQSFLSNSRNQRKKESMPMKLGQILPQRSCDSLKSEQTSESDNEERALRKLNRKKEDVH